MRNDNKPAYTTAGVDLDLADRAKSRLQHAIDSTTTNLTLSAFGAFGGAVQIPSGFVEPALVERDLLGANGDPGDPVVPLLQRVSPPQEGGPLVVAAGDDDPHRGVVAQALVDEVELPGDVTDEPLERLPRLGKRDPRPPALAVRADRQEDG